MRRYSRHWSFTDVVSPPDEASIVKPVPTRRRMSSSGKTERTALAAGRDEAEARLERVLAALRVLLEG